MKFRALRSDEVECRVATVRNNGVSLLLYKDARCDMNILDETVGAMNWERRHTRDNANCTVSIWDESKEQWIEKEDTGTESNTEKEKGLASDSFKRACFNWGIGRELYTAPFIWIPSGKVKVEEKQGRWTTSDRFIVSDMKVEDGRITALEIRQAKKNGDIVFTMGDTDGKIADDAMVQDISAKLITEEKARSIASAAASADIPIDKILKKFNLNDLREMTEEQFLTCARMITEQREKVAKKKKAGAA